jgi:putative transposase
MFVERFWRSIKYEEVYLRAYESVSDARAFDWPLSALLQ